MYHISITCYTDTAGLVPRRQARTAPPHPARWCRCRGGAQRLRRGSTHRARQGTAAHPVEKRHTTGRALGCDHSPARAVSGGFTGPNRAGKSTRSKRGHRPSYSRPTNDAQPHPPRGGGTAEPNTTRGCDDRPRRTRECDRFGWPPFVAECQV